MMRVLFLVLVYVSCSVAQAGVVLFNEFSLGTVIDDEYANVGLMFSTSGSIDAIIVDIGDDANVGTPSVRTASGTGLRIAPGATATDILSITFVSLADLTTPAYTSAASFSYVSDAAGANFGQLRAYNQFNTLIDFQISSLGGGVGGAQEYETLAVSGLQISRLEIDGFHSDVIIDRFDFITPVSEPSMPVPEPSSIVLVLVAVTVGCVRQRRCQGMGENK